MNLCLGMDCGGCHVGRAHEVVLKSLRWGIRGTAMPCCISVRRLLTPDSKEERGSVFGGWLFEWSSLDSPGNVVAVVDPCRIQTHLRLETLGCHPQTVARWAVCLACRLVGLGTSLVPYAHRQSLLTTEGLHDFQASWTLSEDFGAIHGPGLIAEADLTIEQGLNGGTTSMSAGVCCSCLRCCILGSHSSSLSFSCWRPDYVADGVADESRFVGGAFTNQISGLDSAIVSMLGVLWMLGVAMSMPRREHGHGPCLQDRLAWTCGEAQTGG